MNAPRTCESVRPSCLTSSTGLQQSSISSWNHRHGPFQTRRGSMESALRTMATEASPQYAGSACVLYCSMSLKKPRIVPAMRASAKMASPVRARAGRVSTCVHGR